MRILYLIGNGFDINIGMKTKYKDFYEYYNKIKSKSVLLTKLKNNIQGNIINWADLELAFGEYTKNLNSTEEFNEVFEDIQDKIADYLDLEENRFDYSKLDKKAFLNHLVAPENFLLTFDKDRYKSLIRGFSPNSCFINIITFNYTKSIENIIDSNKYPVRFTEKDGTQTSFDFLGIEHIHGFTDKRMVLGVNDISQISNDNFHNNEDVIETLIKSDCNQAQKHNIDQKCENILYNANIICLFGLSIGDTDKIWWERIGQKLKNGTIVLIFVIGNAIPLRRPQKGKIKEREVKELFLSKTKLNENEKNVVRDQIFVGINTAMFKLK